MNSPQVPNIEDERLAFQVQHLSVAIERILREHPLGINELGLIKALQKPPWEMIGDVDYSDPGKLYPIHFLIFHVLYRLRDQVAAAGECLSISPLLIRLTQQDVVGGTGTVGNVDQLRAFYLDLSKYQMPEDAIHQMMDDFWSGRSGQEPAGNHVEAAADTLGFDCVPSSFDEVKKRFRKAVMQAHPDRGGETEAIQDLNNAFSTLKAHFRFRESL
ncbi:DNA-J related domain-containing protein [Marinobacter sp. CHS3-4]|uniref:DNA-J related domain-containing protein n=1 Tax=Marinobacter sp. CHS3-4 TaxID=3045174 RepID=UPI0024B5BD8F|nr:DNA-J related domain-containing protein [Marinobacter sp. CHS3-4]MDI9245726.1 DNA-J related domain-containing protein [Marinobacter sp. CHS3-4]